MRLALPHRKILPSQILIATLLVFTLITAGSPVLAAGIDTSVVVSPGDDYAEVSLPPGMTLGDLHGPFHGQLNAVPGAVRFIPDDSFWDVGSDVTHIVSARSTSTLKIRWVAGATSKDGPVAAISDPGFGQWVSWQLIDAPENPILLVPGLLGGGAYQLNYNPSYPQELRVSISDPAGSGDGASTTSDFQVVIDDVGLNLNRLANEVVTFYRVSEGGAMVVELEARWNEFNGTWQIRPVTPNTPASSFVEIDRDVNQVRLVRWSHGLQSGARLSVNDRLTHTVLTPGHVLNSPEEHELLMPSYTSDATDLQLFFEEPTIHTSGTMDEATTPTIDESFDSGLGAWKSNGVLSALDTEPQTLPGYGQQYVVDLDWMFPLQSAFLQQSVQRRVGGEPDGHGFRFWMDPSDLALADNTSLAVMLGCASTGPCNQLRTRIDRIAGGLLLTTTANNGQGGIVAVDTPIDAKELLVEIRFRNAAAPGTNDGWFELWTDGELRGRVDGLVNHAEQLAQIRLGGLSVPNGASGEVAFDAFETWRFD